MVRVFLAIAAILGGLSVMGGAFGAHALNDQFSEKALAIFETGIKYQMYHALALLLVALLLGRAEAGQGWLTVTGWAFVAGVVVFSGSLYALSFSGINWLGAITPLGGVGLMIGWGCLAVAAFQYR
ncbi:DUF423 domain-containing protein [Spirulina major]|uniref:DUF423 domain-containing protein n=1 Tax=Spirulina major TaxID=270636 RepID=UPI0009323F9A|nr:DUF423 domain-containing protein [Spirulina major]